MTPLVAVQSDAYAALRHRVDIFFIVDAGCWMTVFGGGKRGFDGRFEDSDRNLVRTSIVVIDCAHEAPVPGSRISSSSSYTTLFILCSDTQFVVHTLTDQYLLIPSRAHRDVSVRRQSLPIHLRRSLPSCYRYDHLVIRSQYSCSCTPFYFRYYSIFRTGRTTRSDGAPKSAGHSNIGLMLLHAWCVYAGSTLLTFVLYLRLLNRRHRQPKRTTSPPIVPPRPPIVDSSRIA